MNSQDFLLIALATAIVIAAMLIGMYWSDKATDKSAKRTERPKSEDA